MSIIFIADGYNILHKIKECENISLEQGRRLVIQRLKNCAGSERNRLTIVFDGKSGAIGIERHSGCSVIFSRDEPADNVIKKLVNKGNPKQMVFITDDIAIREFVKKSGARVVGVQEFLSQRTKQKSPLHIGGTEKTTDTDKVDINTPLGYKITEEFKKLWVEKV